jgi:excinuclease ABC subunit B
LRLGEYDVLVGINLLREGLDIPEVSLVAVLDADNEGFLRSERSLIQTAGRAARNVDGLVIFYANRITESIRRAVEETDRRRGIQLAYNETHHIVPKTIQKDVTDILAEYKEGAVPPEDLVMEPQDPWGSGFDFATDERIRQLEKEMKEAAAKLEFEQAAVLRDQIRKLRTRQLLVQ